MTKINKKEAITRFMKSLEIKKNAERRISEEWKRMGITGQMIAL